MVKGVEKPEDRLEHARPKSLLGTGTQAPLSPHHQTHVEAPRRGQGTVFKAS